MTPTLDMVHEAFRALVPDAVVALPAGAGAAPVPPVAAGTTPAGAPAAVPAAAPAVVPGTPGCRRVDPKRQGWHLDVTVAPDQVVAAAMVVDRHGFAMDAVTGVDWMAAGQMEIVYDFFHPLVDLRVVVRARVPREKPELPTISGVFAGANGHERETHDFFGIRFLGHPDLSPLLLPEDADYHPLRKDFPGAS